MKMKKYKHKHIQNRPKSIFEKQPLFHDLITVGDISGQIILLEISKLFSKIV